MKYNEFCDLIKNKIEKLIGESMNVRLEEVIKNNHIVRQAIIISEKGSNVSPSIYLEQYFTDYINGSNISDICRNIICVYDNYKDGIRFDCSEYSNYEIMRNKLYVKVINEKKNIELLKSVPHKKFFDLAMIAYIIINEDDNGRATVNVNNRNMLLWGIESEQLFKDAIENTINKMPPKLEKLSMVMKEIIKEKYKYCNGDESDKELEEALTMLDEICDDRMYVLTNASKSNGAMYIAFNDILGKIYNELEDEFFILPSSIHELLLVPKKSGACRKELEAMVREINLTEVDPGEVLSDSVYEYSKEKGITWE